MMHLEEVEGLVLFKRKHRERDFLVKIFTDKYGPKMFFVRGTKKEREKIAYAIQPLSHGTYIADIRNEGLSFLRDAKDVEVFQDMQTDIFLNAYGTYLLQLTDAALDDGQKAPVVFKELVKGLTAIDEGIDPEIIINLFEIRYLELFGVKPEWRGCVICGNTEGPFDYSSYYGGLLCTIHWQKDLHRYHASPKAIHIIRLLSVLSMDRIGSVKVTDETKQAIRRIIDQIYEENVGLRLKSKKFLENMRSWQNILTVKREGEEETEESND